VSPARNTKMVCDELCIPSATIQRDPEITAMHPNLPTGDVTFFMTDVEGSTRAWELRPNLMREALRFHDELAESICQKHGGFLLKSKGEGDALFIVFQEPDQALRAAVELQGAYQEAEWPGDETLNVRMALHCGTVADARHGDYFGPVVNRCARIKGVGHGGQILCSVDIKRRAEISVGPEMGFLPLGEQRLKSLDFPIELFQIVAEGLQAEFPPLTSINAYPNNLPFQVSSFIGRDEEVRQVRDLLGTKSLVVLLGLGGTGKTRLAIQTGAEVIQDFPGGVWLVELDQIHKDAPVDRAIAETIGITEKFGISFLDELKNYLAAQPTLIILDNCEHILPESTRVSSALIGACPRLKILATSREKFRTPGAFHLDLAPLSMPDVASESRADLLDNPSIQLFLDRASDQAAAFLEDSESLGIIAELCRTLDGVPFMIELAAARARSVPLGTMLDRIEDRFRVLGKGDENRSARQQNLRALIDWSYDLLSPEEKQFLQRVSVFAGGWTMEASESIAGIDPLDPYDVMDHLSALVDKSLVQLDHSTKRYRMLETVRTYGREKLKASDEFALILEQYHDYFIKLAKSSTEELTGAKGEKVFKLLDADIENIRQVIRQLLEPDPESVVVMIVAMFRYFHVRAKFSEAKANLESAMQNLHAGAPQKLVAQASNVLGNLYRLRGDSASATEWFERCRLIYDELGDANGASAALANLATTYLYDNKVDQAVALAEEGREKAKTSGQWRVMVTCLLVLGNSASSAKQYDLALEHFEEARDISQREKLSDLAPYISNNLALIYSKQHRFSESLTLYAELVSSAIASSQRVILLDAFRFSATALLGLERYSDAASLFGLEKRLRELLEIDLGKPDMELLTQDYQRIQANLKDDFDSAATTLTRGKSEEQLWQSGAEFLSRIEAEVRIGSA
jgi:predicted ATPase/class 3 adenylate cyclase